MSTIRDRRTTGLEDRVLDAALRCVARWGLAKTTVDDVAREAGCSRASVYRSFPGKAPLVSAAFRRDLLRFFDHLEGRLQEAADLEEVLTIGTVEAARYVEGHAAFQYLLTHEPEIVLPHIAFHRLDGLFTAAAAFARPYLSRFLPAGEEPNPGATAEWIVRLVLSYTLCPSPHCRPSDEDHARRLVRTYVLPGLAGQATHHRS